MLRTILRSYDVSDSALAVLTSQQRDHATHLVKDSVTFTIDLPSQLTGDINPVSGTYHAARAILSAAGIPTS